MSTPHIVVGTDLSEASLPAVREAGRLAKQQSAKLSVVYVYDPLPWMPPTMVPEDMHAAMGASTEVESAISTILHSCCEQALSGVPDALRVSHIHANPARGLAEYASEHDASLLVVATHGRTGLSRMAAGSVAEQVIRHAPCNVLVVRSNEENGAVA